MTLSLGSCIPPAPRLTLWTAGVPLPFGLLVHAGAGVVLGVGETVGDVEGAGD